MNIEKIEQNISPEEGKLLREEIYQKAREFMPSSVFPGELDPESGSLTIFDKNNSQTRESAVNVVFRYLERADDSMIDKRDKDGLDKFKKYLESL